MSLEERAAYLQNLKEQACLDPVDARARLLSELTDTVSMLCHRIYSIDSVVNGLNEMNTMMTATTPCTRSSAHKVEKSLQRMSTHYEMVSRVPVAGKN